MLLETHFLFNGFFFSYSSFFFPPWEREWESAQDDYFAGISAVSHSPLFQNAMEQRAEGIARLWLSFHSFFSFIFHCKCGIPLQLPPPTHPEGHFMYICRWGECGLYFYSFRCCVRDMRTSHRLTALNVFFSASFLLQQTVWIDAFFFLR